MSGRELSAAADLGDVVSEVRTSERVSAKKAKEAQLEAARLAKELAAAAELEQQVEADLEDSASQGVVQPVTLKRGSIHVRRAWRFSLGSLPSRSTRPRSA